MCKILTCEISLYCVFIAVLSSAFTTSNQGKLKLFHRYHVNENSVDESEEASDVEPKILPIFVASSNSTNLNQDQSEQWHTFFQERRKFKNNSGFNKPCSQHQQTVGNSNILEEENVESDTRSDSKHKRRFSVKIKVPLQLMLYPKDNTKGEYTLEKIRIGNQSNNKEDTLCSPPEGTIVMKISIPIIVMLQTCNLTRREYTLQKVIFGNIARLIQPSLATENEVNENIKSLKPVPRFLEPNEANLENMKNASNMLSMNDVLQNLMPFLFNKNASLS